MNIEKSPCNPFTECFRIKAKRSTGMKLLLFAALDDDQTRLENCVQGLAQNIGYDVIGSFDTLNKQLCRYRNSYALAVVLIAGREELDEILSIDKLFNGLKTIVIVPDRKPETISAALKLHPRYISYRDGDFRDVALVVSHMMNKLKMSQQ